MIDALWMFPVGIIVGLLGSLVGVGGGFILVPAMLFVYPQMSPSQVTAVSLAVVMFNAWSSVVVYGKRGWISWRVAFLWALSGLPGVWLGTWTVARVSAEQFANVAGLSIIAMGCWLLVRVWRGKAAERQKPNSEEIKREAAQARWSAVGSLVSMFVGFVSAFLGVGGGVVHVPVLVGAFGFSPHFAVSMSQFLVAFMATGSTGIHLTQGNLTGWAFAVLWLGSGAVVGSQVGARLAGRVNGRSVMLLLAFVLLLSGARMLLK